MTGRISGLVPGHVSWVWSFRRRHRPALLKLLAEFDGEPIVLRRRREVRFFLSTIAAADSTIGLA